MITLSLAPFSLTQDDSANEKKEAPKTPLTLPGADTFIYRQSTPEPMRLHVFKPQGWKAEDKRPALVFFFGGGWVKGSPEKSASWAKFAAKNGMVGIAPDYRVKDRFNTTPLESVADGRAAMRWIQDHVSELGIDPNRIIVGGNSAGGLLAIWTCIEQTPVGSSADEAPKAKPAGLIMVCAVSDTTGKTGYAPQRFGENTEALSAVHKIDPKMPPTILFHGDADETVPQAQSIALKDKLIAQQTPCEFVSIPQGGHNFMSEIPEWKDKSRQMILDFFKKQQVL